MINLKVRGNFSRFNTGENKILNQTNSSIILQHLGHY